MLSFNRFSGRPLDTLLKNKQCYHTRTADLTEKTMEEDDVTKNMYVS